METFDLYPINAMSLREYMEIIKKKKVENKKLFNTMSLKEYKEVIEKKRLKTRNCLGSRGYSRLLTLKYVP